ncbi:MAG: efflux RND transporter permease subunit, partial [Bacillota bacterium]|nr:efflux RND transporter permease subunit [Bacillota bacterium]
SALGTINGVKTITSNSADNYSTVQLEFNDGTDMSAALVKVSNALDQVKPYLPDEAGTPTIMEISMDMMASVYLGVAYEGKDDFELSQFVDNDLVPYLERQEGVADVNTVGLVNQKIVIELDEDKVQDLNDRILAAANKAFADAYEQLADARKQLLDGQKEIDDGYEKIEDGKKELEENWEKYYDGVESYNDALDEMDYNVAVIENASNSMPMLIESRAAIIGGLRKAVSDSAIQTASETAISASTIATGLYATYQGATATAIAMDLQASVPAIFSTATESAYTITSGSILSEKLLTYGITMNATSTSGIATFELISGAATGLGTLDYIASESGIYSPPGILERNTATVGQIASAIAALPSQAKAGVEQGIAAYNGLREGAGLTKVTWSALDLTLDKIAYMDGTWDALWGSASAYTRSTLMTLKIQQTSLEASKAQLDATKAQLESAEDTLKNSEDSLKDAQKQIDDGWDQYYDSVKAFNKQRAEVLKTANSDQLVTLSTLSQLIYAQNFEMPAGYIDDENDNSWLIKVGQNFESAEEMEDIVLTNIHDVGDVRLSDIANITYIDNRGDEYAKLNGQNAVLLSVFKSSTASTNAVSDKMQEVKKELEAKYEGLKIVSLLDQGEYIDMLVASVLESMLLGAGLAIIILALFLKDVIPTIVVAISIPLSVLLAIVAIYFTGLTLNIMTLAGLALGIGMLVDNSIVVIENIYRIRLLGNSAAKASVLGAKEVAAPIISSTLTTICVFLPIVFANGLVKELIMPMCLTVTYCLIASLAIALSVVPAAGSTLLKNSKPKDHPFFDKVMVKYGNSLKWCLTHKAIPLLVAIALLGLSVWDVIRMGIVMIPEMATEPIQMTVSLPDEMNKEDSYKMIDEIVEKVVAVDGVETVGAMPGSAIIATTGMSTGSGDFHTFVVYVMIEGDNPTAKVIKRVTKEIESETSGFDCDISLSASSIDTSALLGSGLSINIYGDDLDTLVDISEDIMDLVAKVDGYTDISNALEEGDDVVHLVIDKDAAMRHGLSVAQIFADINTRLTEDVTATTLTVSGQEMDVVIKKEYSVPKVENLLDLEFNTKETDDDGDQVTVTHKLSEFATVEKE